MAADLRRVEKGAERIPTWWRALSAVDSEAALLEYVEQMAAAIKKRGMKARPIANFFSMASIEFLRKLGRTCERVGVYALNFVDAAGSMGPAACRYVVSEVKKARPDWPWACTRTTTWDLATANALAGVEAGASQVDVTINGAGARAGNATMAEVVVAIESLYGSQHRNRLEQADRPVESI